MRLIFVSILILYLTDIICQSGIHNTGNIKVHAEGQWTTHNQVDFNTGASSLNLTERTTASGDYKFASSSSWINANHLNHIDGYAQSIGKSEFIFPIGDNNRFRPVAIKNATGNIEVAYFDTDASIAITSNALGGNFPVLPTSGPFDRSILHEDLLEISQYGYWDINGDSNTEIILTWDIQDDINTLTLSSLDRLTIVGWKNGAWEPIESQVDETLLNRNTGDLDYTSTNVSLQFGNITSNTIIPSDYQAFAIGSLRCNKSYNPAINNLVGQINCGLNSGELQISGNVPFVSYTFNYTRDGIPFSESIFADADGILQVSNLPAGIYSSINLTDGICTISFADFEIIENLQSDRDMDGIPDCTELDNGSDPDNPCDPNPLGNLNADCDNDGILNKDDCSPKNMTINFNRLCESDEIDFRLNFEIEDWLQNPNVSFEWYDDDPFATPNNATLLSVEQNPTLPIQKSKNLFYVLGKTDGCPTPAEAKIEIDIVDLSIAQNDEYTLDFARDTSYNLDVQINDNLDIDNINISVLSNPMDGSTSVESDGSITYNTISSTISDFFIYEICDNECPDICEEITVTLNFRSNNCEFIPNGFSPNGDGMNDQLVIPCIDNFPGSSLTIFNRWGDVVYKSKNYQNDWNGLWKSKPLPAGTYFYLIELSDVFGSEYSGYIYIQN